ncbi:MAG: hypothetical protein PHX83_14460 [Acidobacteriia bacterium]|nr:hypothetical protein [Terriglobia bacterium]
MKRTNGKRQGSTVIPPRSALAELVLLGDGPAPRQLRVKRGTGHNATLVDLVRPKTGARIRTWRTFSDEGHALLRIEPGVRSMVMIWYNPGRYSERVDWRLFEHLPEQLVAEDVDLPATLSLEPITEFEQTLASAFGVSSVNLHRTATEAAVRSSVDRKDLLSWIEVRPWHAIQAAHRSMKTQVEPAARRYGVDAREIAVTMLFLAIAKTVAKNRRS